MEVPAEGRELEEVVAFGPAARCESNRETLQLNTEPLTLMDPIQLRTKQLLNRRLFLLEMQSFWKMTDSHGSGASGESSVRSQKDSRLSELKAIEKELKELPTEQREDQSQSFHTSQSTAKSATPCGGIYLLPQLHHAGEKLSEEPRVATGSVMATVVPVPVDSLGQRSAVTQCPCCREVVQTETSSSAGQAPWMVCCLCSMLGCVAGCCLFPFCVERLKGVSHRCPRCRALIHTCEPLSQ